MIMDSLIQKMFYMA